MSPGWSGWHRTLGFVYNSMLLHLLRGELDVDPEAIQWEAVVTGDGKTYAYFGILPALLRLALLPFFDLRTTDVSALTCLAAVVLAAGAKLAALRAVARHAPDASARRPAPVAAAVVTALGGAQIQSHPDGVPALAQYGAFRARALDLVELPPSSFLLSDPLLVALAALGLATLLGRGAAAWDRPAARAVTAGLAVPPALMLTAFVMAFRSRVEFYPLLELLAFVALACAPRVARWGSAVSPRRALAVLAVASVVAAHALLLLYKGSVPGNLPDDADLLLTYRKYLGQGLGKLVP